MVKIGFIDSRGAVMNVIVFLICAVGAIFATTNPIHTGKATYVGYKAIRIPTNHDASAIEEKVKDIPLTRLNVNTKEYMDVAIGPAELEAFDMLGLHWNLIIPDLGVMIEKETFAEYESPARGELPDESWFGNYHLFDDHVKFFHDLQASFPNNSQMVSAGNSYEGRDLYGIHMWGALGKGQPAVYFHGTTHAREWISSMVVEYLAYQLIRNYENDQRSTLVLDMYDFVILPIVNPDGFVYTQKEDRFWRKSRQPNPTDELCNGTDLNRNWPHSHWNDTGGASIQPCSDTYKGASPGDTAEIRGLVDFSKDLATNNSIRLFLDFHSYGQYILIPYGYDCDVMAENHAAQMDLAGMMAKTILEQTGESYTYGQACSALYPTTGDSTDWMIDMGKAEYAWTIELRPGGNIGIGGFVLPADEILDAAQGQWNALLYLIPSL